LAQELSFLFYPQRFSHMCLLPGSTQGGNRPSYTLFSLQHIGAMIYYKERKESFWSACVSS